ncbi:polysaccharide deacetylase family protein [Desulfosarcina ovata]|nr:polysaccharide deacetylase family protein [Desulfosarcina ovata]
MNFTSKLKSISKNSTVNILNALKYWQRKCATLKNNGSIILMYHRIIKKEEVGAYLQSGMYVTPQTFEENLRTIKEICSIKPLRTLLSYQSYNQKASVYNPQPCCCLTFDDGWIDFYHNAFPILKEHNIPATLFVPTAFIGKKKWFWTDRLSFLLCQVEDYKINEKKAIPINNLVNEILSIDGAISNRIEKSIERLKIESIEKIESTIKEISLRFGISSSPSGMPFVNWEQIEEMKNSGLITIGSHTHKHPILTNCSQNEIEMELTESKRILLEKKVVDESFIPFCYPNGNYDEQILQMVKKAGYHLAVTTEKGWNRIGSNCFKLKRIGIHQDITSTPAMFGCRIAGIF